MGCGKKRKCTGDGKKKACCDGCANGGSCESKKISPAAIILLRGLVASNLQLRYHVAALTNAAGKLPMSFKEFKGEKKEETGCGCGPAPTDDYSSWDVDKAKVERMANTGTLPMKEEEAVTSIKEESTTSTQTPQLETLKVTEDLKIEYDLNNPASIRNAFDELAAHVNKISKQRDRYRTSKESYLARIDRLKKDAADVKSKLSRPDQKSDAVVKLNNDLEALVNDCKASLEGCRSEVTRLTEVNTTLKSQVTQLEMRLAEAAGAIQVRDTRLQVAQDVLNMNNMTYQNAINYYANQQVTTNQLYEHLHQTMKQMFSSALQSVIEGYGYALGETLRIQQASYAVLMQRFAQYVHELNNQHSNEMQQLTQRVLEAERSLLEAPQMLAIDYKKSIQKNNQELAAALTTEARMHLIRQRAMGVAAFNATLAAFTRRIGEKVASDITSQTGNSQLAQEYVTNILAPYMATFVFEGDDLIPNPSADQSIEQLQLEYTDTLFITDTPYDYVVEVFRRGLPEADRGIANTEYVKRSMQLVNNTHHQFKALPAPPPNDASGQIDRRSSAALNAARKIFIEDPDYKINVMDERENE